MMVSALFTLLLAAATQPAAPSQSCAAHFLDGAEPKLVNARLAPTTRPLCFRAFAVLHSGVTRGSLWSAERLTASSVRAAIAIEGRSNRFHAEERLPTSERAELDDYVRSGLDRGHMAPSGDMPSRAADDESFSLANIVPQAPKLNQGTWSKLEGMVRDMALAHGTAYVVTGPLFEGERVRSLKGRVLVPTSTWKAIYVPGRGAAAYIATNSSRPRWRFVPVAELAQRAGVDPFPSLSIAAKAKAAAFPLPTSTRARRAGR
ncbi:MAG: hypothetical protein AVDCRST_MAG39-1642 [uncultured Sphingomonadaceae bacterium]|uniref:Endonuclease n=1 Tax=uncultured Sphingomonadaceae bacterium TaxID=169976 RepID=A0A6J4STW1_9SPHN|nr:MAG: hypothetical protein AVDCRST_MAG39-1642 [uncultured Sphingomonadaceae bacterium]